MLSLHDELRAFYQRSGFGAQLGKRPLTVPVYTGCMLVPLPNIETRRRYLTQHDLHHLVTGFSVGRIGEGEVSAWELGTGSMLFSPLLGTMNLIALSTGLVLEPQRMWRAFRLGCRSRNVYAPTGPSAFDTTRWASLAVLRADLLNVPRRAVPLSLRAVEFGCYAALAMLVHALIALPALMVRVVTDIGLGYSVFEIVKPKKRADLY